MACLLFCIASCSLLINFLGDRNISEINKAFVSMHQDRLVPATDLFFIAENLRQKSDQWQDALSLDVASLSTSKHLIAVIRQNANTDSVFAKYEATKIAEKENVYLRDFKGALDAQNKQEAVLLDLYTNDSPNALKIYQSQSRKLNTNTFSSLSDLIKIQSTIGDELMIDSQAWIWGAKICSTI